MLMSELFKLLINVEGQIICYMKDPASLVTNQILKKKTLWFLLKKSYSRFFGHSITSESFHYLRDFDTIYENSLEKLGTLDKSTKMLKC